MLVKEGEPLQLPPDEPAAAPVAAIVAAAAAAATPVPGEDGVVPAVVVCPSDPLHPSRTHSRTPRKLSLAKLAFFPRSHFEGLTYANRCART